ncbi:hypothetical protein IV102_21910 [bacterium]|nr:hypothetical protein [bacterium]
MHRLLLLLLLLWVLPAWGKGPEQPMAVPAHLSQDVDSLATYLTGTANTPRLKAERLFLWVTANINYDIPMLRGMKGSSSRDCTPATVLRRRQSVCQGYANLYQALCLKAGLQAEVVGGWARSSGGGGDSHAWNAVMLDGAWALVDCTWGAGFVRGDDFHRSFSPFYFMSNPKELITSHFPDDPQWQMLDSPITRADFDKLTPFRPYSSGTGTIISLQDYSQGQAIPTSTPAAAGLTAPRLLSSFNYRGVRLILPTAGTLKAGPSEFHLEVPSADRVLVTTGEQTYALLPVPKKFGQYRAMVPIVSGKIRVLAEFGGSGRLEPLLEYDSR